MEWQFSPQDVVKGDVGYTLAHFRADLKSEIRTNLDPGTPGDFERACAVIYDLCYWLATGRSLEPFLAQLGEDPVATRLAMLVREPMAPNVTMLGAILQRMIMDRVEQGLPLEEALVAVEQEHRLVAG
jgi:hypothetical protein